jgi:ribosome biogenesis GTPase / thiamine phosphate phosphatase
MRPRAAAFSDGVANGLHALATTCKFTNCRHDSEPGCAIKTARNAGALDPARLDSCLRMPRKVAALARRENRVATHQQKRLKKRASASQNEKQKRHWNQY